VHSLIERGALQVLRDELTRVRNEIAFLRHDCRPTVDTETEVLRGRLRELEQRISALQNEVTKI